MSSSGNQQNRNIQYAINLHLAGGEGQVGFITLVIVFAALFGGLWLDRRFETKPLFTILLLIGSVPVTLFVMFRVAMSAVAKIKPTAPAGQARPVKEDDSSE
ncbi:MAG: AtpZ/AtpI family protein [Chloroflexota bacterium]